MVNPFFKALVRKAEEQPDAVCFELHGSSGCEKSLSFSQMQSRVASTAHMLAERGVSRGDIVLIFAQHSEGMLFAFFGAQMIGAIPAFMPPPTVKQDLKIWADSHLQLIQRIKPSLIVSEPSCLDHIYALGAEIVVSTNDVEECPGKEAPAALPMDLDQIAFLQHSSGTTGLKKGVMVTYRQLLSQLDAYGDSIGLDEGSSIVSWLPIYHDMGLIAATLLPLYRGVPVTLIDTFSWLSNPSMLMSLLSQRQKAYCWLPNFAFNYLAKRTRLELAPDALRGVAGVINCSEPCKLSDMQAFQERFGPHGLSSKAIQVCYAAAEYVFAITQTTRGEAIAGLVVDAQILENDHRVAVAEKATERTKVVVPVGTPLAGTNVRIGDNMPEGHVGEVIIRGPSTCSGYFRNDDATRQKFVNGWYHTGDLGFIYQGSLYITGRVDDLIIVRGKNIYAHDIEAVVSSVEGVKDGRTTAFGIDDPSGTQQLIVAVEATGEVSTKALKTETSDRINANFGIVPAEIVAVRSNTLVKTTSGKISRSENRKRYLSKALDIAPSS